MKNKFKFIGLISLICFSFFYTDKVITVINEQDPLMIKIKEEKEYYDIIPIDAKILDNTIVPGINGQEVNIQSSYQNMRELGIFNSNYLKYNIIKPSITINNNNDKFIVKGNSNKRSIAIIFTLNNPVNIDKILSILNNNNIKASFFIDYTYLNNNINELRKKLIDYDIYSLGNNLEYTPDTLMLSNNLINRTFNNKALYCLSDKYNISTLNTCSNNDMYTINVELTDYNKIKSNLDAGSIIYLNTDLKTTLELDMIIKFIKSKGLNIIDLDDLLSENK